jgi:hypothetical protein
VGSVGGGIWKTVDGGVSWVALNDFMTSLAVGCMAIDPTNPNVLYVGTGEGIFNEDALRGAGVFKTTDGGATWTQLSSTNDSNWFYVNRIAISPSNSQILLAATNSGIWRSTDGGATWSNRSFTRVFDIDFNPADGSQCVASGDFNARYSTDGGLSWTEATGLPSSGRIELAYARSNPSIVYASVDTNDGELYASGDGGHSFLLRNAATNYFNGGGGSQGWYDSALWVDPTNPNILMVGGIWVWRSTDGGGTLTQVGSLHADQHVIVESPQFNGTSNRIVYFGNDGGIYRTSDAYAGQPVMTELNNNLGVTQFYGGAGNATSGRIIGGTQDNGTLYYSGNTETWSEAAGGDGGWCAADPTDPNFFYGEYQWLQVHRSTNGGLTSNAIYHNLPEAGTGTSNFIAPLVLDPNNPNTLFAAGRGLWRSTNAKTTTAPPTWTLIKGSVSVPISAVAVAKGNSDIIWVGHNNGNVYFTTTGTSASPSWTRADLDSSALPNRYCTRITIDPTNSSRVYATFGGFNSGNVWRTDNGTTWTNITGNLPNAPVYTLAVWQQKPSNLYVGTEVGIFASDNGGQSWSPSNDGPTNCSVDELFWMNDTLVAATHGRGMFSINITDQLHTIGEGAPNPQLFIDAANRNNFLQFAVQPPASAVYRWDCTTCDPNNPTWGKGLIQDFNDVTLGVHDALMLADTNTSFVAQIYGGMWDKFTQLGGLNYNSSNARMLGYPVADRNCLDFNASCSADTQLVSSFGTSYHYQRFQGASLVLHRSGARSGQTYEVHGAIRARWQALGGPGGSFGLPISDEFASAGKRESDFEGGSICFNPTTNQTEDNCPTTTRTLTVASSTPDSGVSVTVSPSDINNAGSGVTQFIRTYNNNTIVTLTAPSTAEGKSFLKWRRNGTDLSNTPAVDVTMDADYALTAVYTPTIVVAAYDSVLKAPKCAQLGAGCDSVSLLDGRDTMSGGPEPNQPNTINNSCADNTSGTYHLDESVDRIKVSTLDGSDLAPGKTVKIEVTVWAFSSSNNFLDLFYASDAADPSWIEIGTVSPPGVGLQTLSLTYVLPNGGELQAVRANFRYTGTRAPCNTGSGYDDHDDLIFKVPATGTRALTVTSLGPPNGVNITVSPSDTGGLGSATTPFTRHYSVNTLVNLTAPATAGDWVFQKWTRDGADFSTSTSASVTMNVGHTLTAVYINCAYSISPTGQNFLTSGGTGSTTVSASAGCPWTAASNSAWISITSGGSGSGTGTVNYSVATNSDSATRTGTITIAGQTFTVNQSGASVSNDHFSGAKVISGASGSAAGSNVGATREVGEPIHASVGGGASVWYRWQAPGAGSTTFTTTGSNFDTVLAVYTGTSVNALNTIASNDDSSGLQSLVTFVATEGTVYYVAVDGYGSSTGNIVLNWSLSGSCGLRIDSVSPPAGRMAGGQQITLTGAFNGLSTVTVDGISSSWSNSGANQITVTTPAHGVGAVSIGLGSASCANYLKSNAFAYLPTSFTDDPLVATVTTAKGQHVLELRQAVDALRAVAGLAPAPWSDASLTQFSTIINAVHILELRGYLNDVAARLGYATAPYTDPTLPTGSVIRRVHIEELRQRIRSIAG